MEEFQQVINLIGCRVCIRIWMTSGLALTRLLLPHQQRADRDQVRHNRGGHAGELIQRKAIMSNEPRVAGEAGESVWSAQSLGNTNIQKPEKESTTLWRNFLLHSIPQRNTYF